MAQLLPSPPVRTGGRGGRVVGHVVLQLVQVGCDAKGHLVLDQLAEKAAKKSESKTTLK